MKGKLNDDLRCEDCGTPQVTGVAIMHDASGLVFSMRKPARHHQIIHAAVAMGIPAPFGNQGYTQGFMTAHGFKDRQLTARLIGWQGHLTSEDLW